MNKASGFYEFYLSFSDTKVNKLLGVSSCYLCNLVNILGQINKVSRFRQELQLGFI